VHTSQAAISKRVRELESAFETPLFDRAHRRARLTAKGEDLLLRGKEMLRLRDQIVEEMSERESLVRRFHFGVTDLTALT
jgi:DNA-binding transcriptional LysR family regulator